MQSTNTSSKFHVSDRGLQSLNQNVNFSVEVGDNNFISDLLLNQLLILSIKTQSHIYPQETTCDVINLWFLMDPVSSFQPVKNLLTHPPHEYSYKSKERDKTVTVPLQRMATPPPPQVVRKVTMQSIFTFTFQFLAKLTEIITKLFSPRGEGR